jgi:hypothetical protein
MVQVVFDLVLLTRPWEYVPRLRPEIGLAVRTAAQFQRYKVIKFVIVNAAPNPVNPHEQVFHRIGVLEGRSDGRRVASPTDGISDIALGNARIRCSWRQVVARQHSRRQGRLCRSVLGMIFGYARKTVQEFSVLGRMHMPKVLTQEAPIVPQLGRS